MILYRLSHNLKQSLDKNKREDRKGRSPVKRPLGLECCGTECHWPFRESSMFAWTFMPIRRKTQNVSCCDEDSALHSLSDWLGRRLLFMVKLYAANDCRNDTLGMAAGSLSGRRKLSAFLELERVTGISLGW